MNIFNSIQETAQLLLKQDNSSNNTIRSRDIRRTVCYAAFLFGIIAVLIGCPDSMGAGNGIATEATKVQIIASGTINSTTITLNWILPIDTDGYLGVTIREENNSGSLSNPVDVDADITTYQVTNLESATEYTFIITTRYNASGKNNSAMAMDTTALPTEIRAVVFYDAATTSDSATLTWRDPEDTTNYIGVTVSVASTVGDLSVNMEQFVERDINNILVISGLDAETTYTHAFTFVTQYSGSTTGSRSEHTATVTTQSNIVTAVAVSDITQDSVALSWTPPEDAGEDYEGVTISAMPDIGDAITVDVDIPEITMVVGSLAAFTPYVFAITTRYSIANKQGGTRTIPMLTTLSMNTFDRDGDTLVDITSLERLDNVRYNLDLGGTSDDGRYKDENQAADNAGLLCGANENTKCTGYELMRSLDFADAGSYDGGMVNTNWRPTSGDPATATNAGWDPIGGNFASRFEGNGYTIRNLYARNIDSSTGAHIGLFHTIASGATVRSIGIQDAALYGSDGSSDFIGAVAGRNNGSVIASYTHNTTANSGAGLNDSTGGLIGLSSGKIIASYAYNSTLRNDAGTAGFVGALLGGNTNNIGATVIASYARGGTVSGGADNSDNVGGLIGATTNNILIAATYSTAAANGGGGNTDNVGGLIGRHNGFLIRASYATGIADGGVVGDTDDRAYALYGFRTSGLGTGITDSYGFGVPVNNNDTGGSNGTDPPTVDGTAITMTEQLTLANAGTTWNSAADDTLHAWDFGDNTEPPALRYADYDDAGNDYHCGNDSIFDGIPTVAASPSGPLTVVCGQTLLPGQGR